MILRSYRSDHPAPVLLLPLLIAVFWAVVPLQGAEIPEHTGMPLHEGVQAFFLQHPWLGWLTGYLLALSGGLLCLLISRSLEFPDQHGNLPALLYPLLMALFPSALWAHPSAFAALFILFAFWRIMRVQEARTPTPPLFDAGFAIGLGLLFHLPVLIVFPFIWIGGFILRTLSWRDFLWPLIGLVIPSLFQWTWYYWNDRTERFFSAFLPKDGVDLLYVSNSEILSYAIWGLMGLFFLSGFFLMMKELQNSNMQGKKLRTAFFIFLLFIGASAFLAAEFFEDVFAWGLLVVPFSFLFVPVFARRSFAHLSSFFLYFWLLVVLLNYYGSSYF